MAQSAHTLQQKHICDIETNGAFPFQSTSSGYLKIIPNQVVYESKKFSVLVADPKHTKVNIKTDINKPDMQLNHTKFENEHLNIKEISGELPPGVTSSTIDQLQAQQKLPQIGTVGYVPRTQPHRIKHRNREMEQQQQSGNQQSNFHRFSSVNEVPLSSLGFNIEEPIDWDNINLPDKTDLYCELIRRITNYTNADFIIQIGHDEFHCHLLVLQCYSTFFDEKNCKEIDITESSVTPKAFSIIYDWMISTTSESCQLLRRDNILEIFMAAQYLGIKELEEQCWAFIDNDELFSEDTAFLLYLEAKKIGNTTVMELMVPRIMKFFLLLVSTKDFLELSVDELCLLLRSNYICVNSEIEVFMSAVRWLMFDWDNRKQYTLNIIKCVRFGLIAPWQLIDVKRNPENREFMELMAFEEVRKMVDDGLAFVIIKYWYGDQTEDYYHWIDLLSLTEPTNRNWADEIKNYVTYREFLLYLDEYQRTIMPELKLRRGKSISSNHQQCTELLSSNRTHDNVGLSSNNTMNLPNTTLPLQSEVSTSTVSSNVTPDTSTATGMSLGFFSKYLTSPGSQQHSKTNTCDNEMDNDTINVADPAVSHNTWKNLKLIMPGGNYYDTNSNECKIINNNIQYKHQLEPNIIITHGKYFHKKRLIPARHEDNTDSSKSQDEASMNIQASCRRYKTRRNLNRAKKFQSDENHSIKKIAELLSNTVINNKYAKQSVPTRAAPINIAACKSHFKNSARKYRSGSACKKQTNSPTNQIKFNECTSCDVEKFEQMYTQKNSKPSNISTENNTLINHLDESKPTEMNRSTTLLYNFDGRMSSAMPSDNNNDSEILYSSTIYQQNTINKYTNFYRFGPDTEQNKSIEKPINYFPDYSLFYSECEAVLIFGGIDPHLECGVSGNTGKDMYRYKPVDNVWEFVGEIPEPRHHHSTTYLNGRVYLMGGNDPREDELQKMSIVVGTVWSYDPSRRQWFNEPEMLTPRQNFGVVVSQGKIFAIGGQDKNGIALKSVEAFDPLVGKWEKMQPMNTPRIGAACANFQDFIWVAGGLMKLKILKEVECYDPVKNMWHKIESLRVPRCYASLYANNDCLYLIGGAQISPTYKKMTESIETIDVWDTNLRSWSQLTEMSIARHCHTVGSIGNQLLIIGGVTTVHKNTLACVECFCCERLKCTSSVASLPYAIFGHGSVSLPPLNILEHF